MQPASSVEQPKVGFWRRALDNPIIVKELKGRMRDKRGFTLVAVYLGLLAFFIALVYLFMSGEGSFSRNRPGILEEAGRALFGTVVLSELLLIMFIAPALTSGAISAERERQTFDLLRVSLLSPRALLFGKLASAMAYLLLLVFTAIPLQSLAFVLGGVGATELLVSLVLLVVTALLFCSLGLYFSSIAKRAAIATTLSYGAVILPVILEAIFIFWLLSSPFYDWSDAEERLFLLSLWMSASTNPLSAAFLSEVMLIEEQNAFLFFAPDVRPTLALFSPWILYTVYALILTAFMIWLSAFYLKRYEY